MPSSGTEDDSDSGNSETMARPSLDMGAGGQHPNECLLRLSMPKTIKLEREKTALKAFLAKMNETAKRLGLKNSNWAVSHGMHHDENYSSALDVAMLA